MNLSIKKRMRISKKIYPDGIHAVIAGFLGSDDMTVHTATLPEPECGLTQEVLYNTDVLIWCGHAKHQSVPDEVAVRVHDSVLKGMGFIALHSAHLYKPFPLLMGTACNACWREDGDFELIWGGDQSHPITRGLDRYFELEHEETYSEPFGIPQPDKGKVFYFQPGHETYPTYYDKNVQIVIRNAVYWCKSDVRVSELNCPNVKQILK